MKITMIGHAGLLIETSAGGILADPWLFGPAFNESWDLLEDSYIPEDLWDRVNYLWFSHEHPDHFHTASVRSIPVDKRSGITVLFQESIDRKVVKYLSNLGFNCHEIKHKTFFSLSNSCRIYLEVSAIYDSWIAIEDSGQVFIDFNDCALLEVDLKRIKRKFPNVDALMTQFSFAGWIGNEKDDDYHISERLDYLNKIEMQTAIIKPKAVIPAASFIRFSHVDNHWMNRWKGTIVEAVERIVKAGSTPIVLRPGDDWLVGDEIEIEKGVNHYVDMTKKPLEKLHSHDSVELSVISNNATLFADKIRESNNIVILKVLRYTLSFLSPIIFRIKDLDKVVRIDPMRGTFDVLNEGERYDVLIHSYALNQLLAQPSGIDTLIVSGLFESADKKLFKLHNSFNINSLNNAGIELKFRVLFSLKVMSTLYRIGSTWLNWRIRHALPWR